MSRLTIITIVSYNVRMDVLKIHRNTRFFIIIIFIFCFFKFFSAHY